MYGITYNNKHSFKDFGIKMLSQRIIQPPIKKKINVTVPFMSGSYDFSDIYNSNHFEERVLEYQFLIKTTSVEALEIKRITIENWLLSGNQKTILKDDILRGYYYLAECTEVQAEEVDCMAKITVLFTAYPFKICEACEGELLWDSFNFELDMLQKTKFEIDGQKKVAIYNQSIVNVTPFIICDAPFKIKKNDMYYEIPTGTVNDYRFELEPGINNLIIKGKGNIEFRFRKEVL